MGPTMRAIDPAAMFSPSMAPCRSGGDERLIRAEMLGMARDMPQAPIPTRLVCAAYRIVQRVLPLQPNEVWQRIRSSNVVLGSPGAVPLRASQASLSSAHAGAFSRLLDAEVRISMDGRGRWMDNVFIERLWRSLKYECVYLHAFETGSELRAGLGRWITYYNTQRPHSGLAGRTPVEAYRRIGQSDHGGHAPHDLMIKQAA